MDNKQNLSGVYFDFDEILNNYAIYFDIGGMLMNIFTLNMV